MDSQVVNLKFLITGAAGLIGNQLAKDLSKSNEVFSCYNQSKPEFGTSMRMDLQNYEMISDVFSQVKPDAVIHLGAMTGVDLCETNELIAFDINSKATELIAKQCSDVNSFLIYVSTDYVFDGELGMYNEDHNPNPISIYGKSKHDGEKAVQNFTSNWCIARTSTPYGIHATKKSFPTWIIDTVKQNKLVNIVSDQFTSPTYVPNLSKMLMEISEKKINGIIHTADTTRISRYNMAELIFDKFNLNKTLLKPVTTDQMKWDAKRPSDSSLNVTKASSVLDSKPQSLEESLEQFFDETKIK